MTSSPLLVVGAGHAAGELAAALRNNGLEEGILLLGDEPHPPYQRPALSKDFLIGKLTREQPYVRSIPYLKSANIKFESNTRVIAINRHEKSVRLSDGTSRKYSKLVLATGGRPRRLAIATPLVDLAPNVHYLCTIEDVNRIRNDFKHGARLLIIGGGYIGLEVAAAARACGLDVTLIESLPRLLARVAAPVISDFFLAQHRDAGADILLQTHLTDFSFDSAGRAVAAQLQSGESLAIDLVLIGIGLIPNSELAQGSGLKVDNGIVVDEHGQTSDPDVLVIGDCSNHWNNHARRRIRLESVPRSGAGTFGGRSHH